MAKKVSAHQARKEADLKTDFNKLSSITEFGVKKYSHDYIINKLAWDYYYSPVTVEKILNGQYERERIKRENRENKLQATASLPQPA